MNNFIFWHFFGPRMRRLDTLQLFAGRTFFREGSGYPSASLNNKDRLVSRDRRIHQNVIIIDAGFDFRK